MDANDGIGIQRFKQSTFFDRDSTACISEESALLERIPFGAGHGMREMLDRMECAVSSVMWNNGPNFFGLKNMHLDMLFTDLLEH